MKILCQDCQNTYEHYEHQRCYKCGVRVPVPKEMITFTNSTLCGVCFSGMYAPDGSLIFDLGGK